MSSVCTPAFRVSELRRRKITFATRLLFPHLLLEFKIQSVRKERERGQVNQQGRQSSWCGWWKTGGGRLANLQWWHTFATWLSLCSHCLCLITISFDIMQLQEHTHFAALSCTVSMCAINLLWPISQCHRCTWHISAVPALQWQSCTDCRSIALMAQFARKRHEKKREPCLELFSFYFSFSVASLIRWTFLFLYIFSFHFTCLIYWYWQFFSCASCANLFFVSICCAARNTLAVSID